MEKIIDGREDPDFAKCNSLSLSLSNSANAELFRPAMRFAEAAGAALLDTAVCQPAERTACRGTLNALGLLNPPASARYDTAAARRVKRKRGASSRNRRRNFSILFRAHFVPAGRPGTTGAPLFEGRLKKTPIPSPLPPPPPPRAGLLAGGISTSVRAR